MALAVQKCGGSPLEGVERTRRVAERIVETKRQGSDVAVVCSAMGNTTDELLDLAEWVSPVPPGREMGTLLTVGEHISNALVAMAIANFGASARSFTDSQADVIITEHHDNAYIIKVIPDRIREVLDGGHICLVAGFQGMSRETKDVITLGHGGSDTTAVVLAATLETDVCEIYPGVDGVYTANPCIAPGTQCLNTISPEEMLEMVAVGAKIL